MLGVSAGSADAYVYWADSKAKTIGRAANDGTAVEPAFIKLAPPAVPAEVDVSSTHIYWADENGKAIGRANLDGSNVAPHFVSLGSDEPTGVAVNGTHIYWSAMLANRVGRVALDGTTGFKADLVSGLPGPSGIALDSGHVYWSSATQPWVGRAGLSGSTPDPDFVIVPGTPVLRGVAVNTTNLFFAEFGLIGGGTQIGRANVATGMGADPSFIGNASSPCGVAVFGSKLYWTNLGNNSIGTANTDSSGVKQDLIGLGGEGSLCGIAVDALAPPPQPGNPGGGGGGGGGGTGATNPPASDTTPPQTRIAAGPGKRLDEGRASFLFSAGEAATFTCKLDARKATSCGRQGAIMCMAVSPQCMPHRSYSGLNPGRHTFKVWATDAAGNKDPTPAKRRFRVPADV